MRYPFLAGTITARQVWIAQCLCHHSGNDGIGKEDKGVHCSSLSDLRRGSSHDGTERGRARARARDVIRQ